MSWHGRNPDGSQTTSQGITVSGVTLRRGENTALGQAGYCVACDRHMPDGPDACLGLLPGVSHACCGHGELSKAYVSFGDYPDQPANDSSKALYGMAAARWFAERKPIPWWAWRGPRNDAIAALSGPTIPVACGTCQGFKAEYIVGESGTEIILRKRGEGYRPPTTKDR